MDPISDPLLLRKFGSEHGTSGSAARNSDHETPLGPAMDGKFLCRYELLKKDSSPSSLLLSFLYAFVV
jgi:hypothetical protein